MITTHDIQTLKEIPIDQVAEATGLHVNRHKSLCPFHDDSTPSLTFYRNKNCYHCFVCSAHGSTIDLVAHHLRLSFRDACCWLAQTFNISLDEDHPTRFRDVKPRPIRPTHKEHPSEVDREYLSELVRQPFLNEEACHFLFEERRLNPAVVRWCGISSCSQSTPCRRNGYPFYDGPSLLIPYRDIDGTLMSVQGRYLRPSRIVENTHAASDIPRFRFPKGSRCHLYNAPILRHLQPNEPLYIAEGCSDCWALLSAGHKAIAIPSATLLKDDDLLPLKSLNLHIYPDADAPGEHLYQDLRLQLPQLIRHRLPTGIKDFAQYWSAKTYHLTTLPQ